MNFCSTKKEAAKAAVVGKTLPHKLHDGVFVVFFREIIDWFPRGQIQWICETFAVSARYSSELGRPIWIAEMPGLASQLGGSHLGIVQRRFHVLKIFFQH